MCDDQQFGITPWRNNSPACNLSMKLDKDELVEVRKLAFAFKPATIQSLRDKINKLMREDHRCVQRSNSERIERL